MNYEEPYSLDEQISVTMTRIDRLSILAALSVTILGARRADDDNLLRKHTHARDAMLREPQLAVDALRAKWDSIPWAAIREYLSATATVALACNSTIPFDGERELRQWLTFNAPKPED